MKRATLAFVALCTLLPATASAGNDKFCRSISRDFSKWVMDSRKKLDTRSLDSLQNDISRNQQYRSVTDRVSARANTHLNTSLSQGEVQADLYGLCMSLT